MGDPLEVALFIEPDDTDSNDPDLLAPVQDWQHHVGLAPQKQQATVSTESIRFRVDITYDEAPAGDIAVTWQLCPDGTIDNATKRARV